VQTITLDEIVEQHKINPSLVKIDCEGFEKIILTGGSHLLESMRPTFMIECNDNALKLAGTNRIELFKLLHYFDYKLFHLASFSGGYPLGITCDENFPASEFNFTAVPNDDINLARWHRSIK
ncbi:FkbM family methyltransferase, partial [Moorena sp. SIO3I6]|uniref:FkbM family methyltransferase n=1 Tax=Moorena sp. SIO3I6 TaxID=2607831 RepID=UPI0013FB632E